MHEPVAELQTLLKANTTLIPKLNLNEIRIMDKTS
jgi:hypothetical protein